MVTHKLRDTLDNFLDNYFNELFDDFSGTLDLKTKKRFDTFQL